MNYYTKELWIKINSESEEERIAAEKLWSANDKAYCKYYQKIKKYLPEEFRNVLENGELHDCLIERITIDFSKKGQPCVFMRLLNGNKEYQLVFEDVSAFEGQICDLSYAIQNRLSWSYAEIEILSIENDVMIKLSVLCDVMNEISFQFGKIAIETIDRDFMK